MNPDSVIESEGEAKDKCEIGVQDEVGINTNLSGEIIPKNEQVLDYMQRGPKLEQISLWEYIV